jgi:N-methylhydantoinase B/oxoprolinase/acetone carboxylase alpha subunit
LLGKLLVLHDGGGYGDPHERDREAVLEDVGSGYLTASRAAQVYDVEADATPLSRSLRKTKQSLR